MVHWFKTLWAQSGDRVTIPEATDPNGYVSMEAGYPADYERVKGTDPLAKSPTREELNEILYAITGAVQQYQKYGFPDYIDATANGGTAYAYALNSIVRFTDGKNYQNTVASNTNAPNVSGWIEADLSLFATIASSFAQSQTYVDVTATRAAGTTYTNSTGAPIWVTIDCYGSSATPYTATYTVGGVDIAVVQGGQYENNVSYQFPVPPLSTYSVTISATAAVTKWVELR